MAKQKKMITRDDLSEKSKSDRSNISNQTNKPIRNLTSNVYISAVKELEPYKFYCDIGLKPKKLKNFIVESIDHCIHLRLIHYYGPCQIGNQVKKTVYILVARCVHDQHRNVIISVELDGFPLKITTDHINRTFTLKNFITQTCPQQILFNLGDLHCNSLHSPFYKIFIIASKQYNSILTFFNDEDDGDDDIELMECDDDTDVNSIDSETTIIEDIAFFEREIFMTDEDSDLTSLIGSKSSSISSVAKNKVRAIRGNDVHMISEVLKPITKKYLTIQNEIPPSSMEIVPIPGTSKDVNNVVIEMKNDAKISSSTPTKRTSSVLTTTITKINQSPIKRAVAEIMNDDDDNLLQELVDHHHNEQIKVNSFKATKLDKKIVEILKEMNDSLKNNFNLNTFHNFDVVINEENVELTKLSQVVCPSNTAQKYSFVNIVAMVSSVSGSNLSRCEIILFDQTCQSFPVLLAYEDVDAMKQKYAGDKPSVLFNPGVEGYPALFSGDIVLIRDLCLGLNLNLCPHPNQLKVIKSHIQNSIYSTGPKKPVSKQEMKCLIELICFHVNQLMNPRVRVSGLSKVINLVGQILTKRIISESKRAEVFLFMPFKNYPSSYVSDSALLIFEQLENSVCSHNFPLSMVKNLINENYILKITVYDNHVGVFDSLAPMDLLLFYNLHIKEDRFYNGFYQYILHGGNDFGRRCVPIDKNGVIGEKLVQTLHKIQNCNFGNSKMMEDILNYEKNLDPSVLNQFGEQMSSIIKQMNEAEDFTLETHVHQCLKKNIFSCLNKHHPLFKPFVNIDAAVHIQTFDVLTKDFQTNLFEVNATFVNYFFEDEFGIEIQNMVSLRKRFMKMVCFADVCNYATTFISTLSNAAGSIASEKQITCPNCSSKLIAHLAIELILLDSQGKYLCVLLSSPEIENLISCSNSQLIYTDPLSVNICNAYKYMLRSLCPKRIQGLDNKKKSPMLSNTDLSLQCYDWVLQAVTVDLEEFDFTNYPHLNNKQLFGDNKQEIRIFQVRSITVRT